MLDCPVHGRSSYRFLYASLSWYGVRQAVAIKLLWVAAGMMILSHGLSAQVARPGSPDSVLLRWLEPDVPVAFPGPDSRWHYEEVSVMQLASGPVYLVRSGTAELNLNHCASQRECDAGIRATTDSLGSGASRERARAGLIEIAATETDLLASFTPLLLPPTVVAVGDSWAVNTGYEVETGWGPGAFAFNGLARLDSVVGGRNRLAYISVNGTSRTALEAADGVLHNADFHGTYVWNITEGRLEHATGEESGVIEPTNGEAPYFIQRTRKISRPGGGLSGQPPPPA